MLRRTLEDTRAPRALLPLALALALVAALAPGARAAGLRADYMAAEPPPSELAELWSLSVKATLSDTAAEVTETRTYGPPWTTTAEAATITFFRPLPDGATVAEVRVNGTPQPGQVLPPAEADALRRALVTDLRDPSPLRDLGTPLFVMDPLQVPFGPWMQATVEVTLTQPFAPHGTMRGVSLPVDWHKKPVESVVLDVTAATEAPLRALYAPYHKLDVTRDDAHTLRGTYYGYQRCTAFDVTLLLSTGDEPIRLDLLPYRYGAADDGFFMALLSPGSDPGAGAVVPRDIVLVVDRSGSMSGTKMSQAKEALSSVLKGLRPEDSFAIVAFDSVVEAYAKEAQLATPANLEPALAFVDALEDGGSTNLHDAILTAFQSMGGGSNPKYLVVLTDGQPTAGVTETDAILAMAAAQNEVGARLFAFGIGYDVNTVLLDKLAMQSAGDALYILPGQSVATVVEAFFQQIADPVLTDPVLDLSDFGASALYPAVLGDVFAGQTITVLGRYTGGGSGQVVLSGSRGGTPESHVWSVTLPGTALTEGYVPRVWATRHLGELLQEVKLGDTDPALVDEALTIANRFGVVTEFTYFQVDEDGDTQMVYSAVPVDAVGSVAVGTSSTLDSYQKGGTVDAPVDTYVRYFRDRTFPSQGGWFTDTTLGDGAFTDLHFASEAWFALAEAEAAAGIGGFLAVGRNVRFEHLGRRFRVTDPADHGPYGLPAESDAIPAPAELAGGTDTAAIYDPDAECPEETAPGEEAPAEGGTWTGGYGGGGGGEGGEGPYGGTGSGAGPGGAGGGSGGSGEAGAGGSGGTPGAGSAGGAVESPDEPGLGAAAPITIGADTDPAPAGCTHGAGPAAAGQGAALLLAAFLLALRARRA